LWAVEDCRAADRLARTQARRRGTRGKSDPIDALAIAWAALNRTISGLEQELEMRTNEVAPALLELPGCATLPAAKLLAEIGADPAPCIRPVVWGHLCRPCALGVGGDG
jgi:transposase